MKQYDTYKDSGIAWIGEIPSRWEISRIKNVCIFCPSDDKSLVLDSMGYAPMNTVRYGSIDAGVINKDKLPSGLTYFANGDIVMAKVTPCFENGNIAIAKNLHNGCAYGSSELFVFRATHVMKEFLFYALQNEIFKGACCSTMTGTGGLKRVSPSFVYNASIAIPNINEQQSIASFLDTKCGEIDALISLQEEMISELQAYKQSVITEAVTKGLNPHAKMKDSGVEWIGEIPEGWNLCKIQYLSNLQSGKNLTTEQITDEGIYPVYGGNGIRGYYPEYTHDGDYVIIGRQGALCGNINYAHGKFWPTEHAVVCHPKVQYNYTWFGEVLRTMNLGQYSLASAQPGLAVERIKQLSIPVPPLPEQHSIATYLDEKTSQIDSLISLKQEKIQELKDYKKSIIYEYVTGKKKV